jgi:hypothetical protein
MKPKPRRQRLKVHWRNDAWTPPITAGPPSSRSADRSTPLAISRSRLQIHVWDATGVVPFLDLESFQLSPSAIASTSTKAKL